MCIYVYMPIYIYTYIHTRVFICFSQPELRGELIGSRAGALIAREGDYRVAGYHFRTAHCGISELPTVAFVSQHSDPGDCPTAGSSLANHIRRARCGLSVNSG